MASTFPSEAKSIALKKLIPSDKATKNVASELRGKIVAAKNAERKSANSAILYSRLLKR